MKDTTTPPSETITKHLRNNFKPLANLYEQTRKPKETITKPYETIGEALGPFRKPKETIGDTL